MFADCSRIFFSNLTLSDKHFFDQPSNKACSVYESFHPLHSSKFIHLGLPSCVCECCQYKFPAFQAGPRVCLGRNMAMLEAKMCISVLLKHFDFKFADGFKMMYKSR